MTNLATTRTVIRWLACTLLAATLSTLSLCTHSLSAADEPVYSGPQKGEKLPTFKIRGVLGEGAGKELDFGKLSKDKTACVIFMHKLTRPSAGLTRYVAEFAAAHPEKIATAVVLLGDDGSMLEARIKRAARGLPRKTLVGYSPDGQEGPGAFGLNRDVILTVLAAKDGKVTANFALVQPSLEADGHKIAKQVATTAGVKPPARPERPRRRKPKANTNDKAKKREAVDMRALVGPLIRKDNTVEQTKAAAERIEAAIKRSDAARQQVGRAAAAIVRSGKFENYGTPTAQQFLEKWAKLHGPKRKQTDKKKQ